jgi:hypothetical protein
MRLVQARFSHPRPRDTTEHQRIFRCPLAFEQPRNELVIRRKDLDFAFLRPIQNLSRGWSDWDSRVGADFAVAPWAPFADLVGGVLHTLGRNVGLI